MKPIINWDVIQELVMPHPPQNMNKRNNEIKSKGQQLISPPQNTIGGWDEHAQFYDMMVQFEKPYTQKQIDLIEHNPNDTMLDVCSGSGRLVIPMAKKLANVTALDASQAMLDICKEHAKEESLNNIDYFLADWKDDKSLENLKTHDIVICSRSLGLWDIEKLTSYARKWVGIIIWHNGCPSIPEIINLLFDGVDDSQSMTPHNRKQDRRLGDNVWYNHIYDLGYDVNIRVLEDGYTHSYKNREEAYLDLTRLYNYLKGDMPKSGVSRFHENIDKYITENPDGTVTFLVPTGSIMLWWKPEKQIK